MSFFFLLFLSSCGFTAIKNINADAKIERNGYKISEDNRSPLEIAISFIKDYFFLIIPFYNIFKSVKLLFSNDTEYASKRFADLQDRERISVIEDNTPEVVDVEDQEEYEPEKQTINNEPKTTEELEINFTKDELLDYYYLKNKELRSKYKRLLELKRINEAKELREVIIEVTNRYNAIKAEKDFVLKRK